MEMPSLVTGLGSAWVVSCDTPIDSKSAGDPSTFFPTFGHEFDETAASPLGMARFGKLDRFRGSLREGFPAD
jgi:hypothetical protein